MGKKLKITFGALFLLLAVLGIVGACIVNTLADYKYTKDYMSNWNLADKSSTLQTKADYISKFVTTIETNRNDFADYDAIFLQTNDNSFEYNLQAVKTLNDRLKQVSQMNESSFEYQTAMQQITGQEMGEAHQMLNVIESTWYLKNYPFLWGWIAVIGILGIIIMGVLGVILITLGLEE